ncbi:MAG TPA: hypothetical protein VN033_10230 [Vulgatibacter sp.]|nr:hypothetical protein [Vulgatibacter sp.]
MTLAELFGAVVLHHTLAALGAEVLPPRRIPAAGTRRAMVLAALEHGQPVHARELAKASGQTLSPTLRDLRELIADGLVLRVGPGTYQLRETS